MAAGAADGKSEERFAGGTDHFVEGVGPDLCRRLGVLIAHVVVRSGHEEGASYGLIRIVSSDHVAGQAVAQFRIDDAAATSSDDADVRELSDDELMARARRAAQASMDALLSDPDDPMI